MLKTLSTALCCLLLSACMVEPLPHPRDPSPTTPEEAAQNRARADRERGRRHDEAAVAAQADLEAKRAAHDALMGARAEARTTYLAQHPERPEHVRAALLAGDRIVPGMTMDEARLVLFSPEPKEHGVSADGCVTRWSDGLTLSFKNGVLVSWSGPGGPASVEQDLALRQQGEQIPQPARP